MRIVAGTAIAVLIVAACALPPGRQFRATLGIAEDLPLPVILGDLTGLVREVRPAWLEAPPPVSSFTVAGGRAPNELVAIWIGGLCDGEATFAFATAPQGYSLHLEVRRDIGSCALAGVVRALRIELTAPIDPHAVSLSGTG